MSLHLEEQADGGFAFYIDGDLQFDTLDEALYHESLALPALCLAEPAHADALRVLICGGGDGLALRECLRFPHVSHVDLVDYDPDVVNLGRTRFADLNRHAFDDPRATVHIQDAWEFLAHAAPYDVVLCDFTVPRRPEDTRIFSAEWYARVREALSPGGVVGLNAVSPQTTPEAFWCLRRTVRQAGLSALPYRVCLPSFRAQGYGAWAFMLAAPRPLKQSQLRALRCPISTRQTDLTRLWRGARFSRAERHLEQAVPVHSLDNPCLMRLLLNPGGGEIEEEKRRKGEGETLDTPPYDLNPLLHAIPILHPYHTRQMVETLAAQVMGTVRGLDIQRLVDALLQRAKDLPRDLCRELGRLKDFLRERLFRFETFGAWSQRLFVTLVILMTLANAISPDNAFAKGSFGLGHASMSRGYSGSFGGSRGFGSAGRGTSSSFGGERGFGSSFGASGRSATGSFGTRPGIASSFGRGRVVTGGGFRRSYGRGEPTDIYGYAYSPRVYIYCGSGVGHVHPNYVGANGTRQNAPPPETHRALFIADEDMLVMDNGDVILTLSDTAYLLITGGTMALMSNKLSDPLVPLYSDPNLFQAIANQIQEQQGVVKQEIGVRQDWLSWVGWTSALFGSVQEDKQEVRNLDDLGRRLNAAQTRLVMPPATATPVGPLKPGQVELFAGGLLMEDGTVTLRGPDDTWLRTDGRQIWSDKVEEKRRHCPPELNAVLKSLLLKLQKELTADLSELDNNLKELASDRTALDKDLQEYQRILQTEAMNDGTYEVDYGTEEIGVSQAITRTQRDIEQNTQETTTATDERAKTSADLERLSSALKQFAP